MVHCSRRADQAPMFGKYLSENSSLPLKGNRILLTSPRQYADRLSSRIFEFGGRPVWLPGIEVAHLTEPEMKKTLVSTLRNIDCTYILFSSKNGVFSVIQELISIHGNESKARSFLNNGGFEIWALGADADALTDFGILNVKKPKEASTQGLVEELSLYGQGILEGGQALCPIPAVIPPLIEPPVVPKFLKGLKSIGLDARAIPAYETRIASSPEDSKPEIGMLLQGDIKAIAFSSTAEVQGLASLVGREKLVEASRRHRIILGAHGPATAKGVFDTIGVEVDCISSDSSTFEGMITAIAEKL